MLTAEDENLDAWNEEAPDSDEESLLSVGYGQPPLPIQEGSNPHQ